jgi:hypothetical protein
MYKAERMLSLLVRVERIQIQAVQYFHMYGQEKRNNEKSVGERAYIFSESILKDCISISFRENIGQLIRRMLFSLSFHFV